MISITKIGYELNDAIGKFNEQGWLEVDTDGNYFFLHLDPVGPNYSPGLVCTNTANALIQVWTGSSNLFFPSIVPSTVGTYFKDIAAALEANPNAFYFMQGGRPQHIPEQYRGLERIDSAVEPARGFVGEPTVAGVDYIPQPGVGQLGDGNGIAGGWSDPFNLWAEVVGSQYDGSGKFLIGASSSPGIDFIESADCQRRDAGLQHY